MNITANVTVSYDIKTVKVANLFLSNDKNGLVISAPYEWLDASGKSLRNGSNRYNEAQITVVESARPAIAILKTLVPNEKSTCMVILTDDENNLLAIKTDMVNGKLVVNKLNSTQFATAINPMTIEQLKAVVQQFAVSVLSN